MASPTQRIQVLLRPRALEVVKELSEQEDLTLSKTVAMLVNEALEARGVSVRSSRSGSDLDLGPNMKTVMKKTESPKPQDFMIRETPQPETPTTLDRSALIAAALQELLKS